MIRGLSDLAAKSFDLAIIGGGITGACLAHDAALRGLSVALVEKGDFGAATSSASSKLLHGGIRYLQQGMLRKVRESAIERCIFQTLAPHLTRYIPFVIPTYKGLRKGKAPLRFALIIYNALCAGQNRYIRHRSKRVPRGHALSRQEVLDRVPALAASDVTGGIVLYESHMHNSERMTLAFLDSAFRHGATLANYVRVDSLLREGDDVIGVRATDTLTGNELHIRASIVVNAAGPWIPSINKQVCHRKRSEIVTGFSKGAHVVATAITRDCAIALQTQKRSQAVVDRGGRHVFIIPWRGHSLIGTTYSAYRGDLDDVRYAEDDIMELIGDVNSAFGKDLLDRANIVFAYAGIYPLVDDTLNFDIYQGTGRYQVVDHQQTDGVGGLMSVFGAKFTTARLLAEKALDMVTRKIGRSCKPCGTRHRPLVAGDIADLQTFRTEKIRQYASTVSASTVDHLIRNYGTGIEEVMSLAEANTSLAQPVTPGRQVIGAEIVHGVEHEMAVRLEDVVFRRTGLGTLGSPGERAISRCADIMGRILGWSSERRQTEIAHVESQLNP